VLAMVHDKDMSRALISLFKLEKDKLASIVKANTHLLYHRAINDPIGAPPDLAVYIQNSLNPMPVLYKEF
jgi:hypothetical protein